MHGYEAYPFLSEHPPPAPPPPSLAARLRDAAIAVFGLLWPALALLAVMAVGA